MKIISAYLALRPEGTPPPEDGVVPVCEQCGLSTWVELGGGDSPDSYHPNIDIKALHGVDILTDLELGIPLHDNHAERIKTIHLINHLSLAGGKRLIEECYRVLRPGGSLFIMMSDMEWAFERQLRMWRQEFEYAEFAATCIWGEQRNSADVHKSGYSFSSLKWLLENVGFNEIHHLDLVNPWDLKVEAVK